MDSTFSTSSNSLDRKSLKRPDGFVTKVSGAFTGMSKHSGVLLIAIVSLVAACLAITTTLNKRETQANAARNALYSAEQALQAEMKALAGAEKPASGSKSKDTDPLRADLDAIAFKKLDVDSKFQNTVKKLTAVDANWSGTRAAFEARQKLGILYFNHGEFSKALPWYEKALASAPNSFEKAQTLSSLGYVYENLGKPSEAIQFYQKAINLGEGSLKGDLLMAVARSYEALHDTTKARSTYDQILVDLPNTDFAKSAELYKNNL